MKFLVCSLLLLAVLEGFSCAPWPEEQYGTRGHSVGFNLDAGVGAGIGFGKGNDGLFRLQGDLSPRIGGNAGYYNSFLPPPGFNQFQG